uniref:Uncharacterized protein n=1 Tax=Avena sativa TaxID=4498 RepID=A0ACD5ZFF1_AVESA
MTIEFTRYSDRRTPRLEISRCPVFCSVVLFFILFLGVITRCLDSCIFSCPVNSRLFIATRSHLSHALLFGKRLNEQTGYKFYAARHARANTSGHKASPRRRNPFPSARGAVTAASHSPSPGPSSSPIPFPSSRAEAERRSQPDAGDSFLPFSADPMEASSSSAGPAPPPPPPPSIRPSSDQCVWADASQLVAAACADLQDGELVHGENFSLFAAMSALEIMDPKMDSGMERSGYYSIEEAIEDGIAPVPLSLDKTLDTQRTIDVIDHLFSCEATWHKGHTLAQTVFTCIYLMKIERISSHAVLNSFCRILRATCNAVISVVSTARTHEEEDLFTMSFGLALKDEGDDKCLSVLNSVEETISRQLRACKSQALSKKKTLEGLESLQDNPALEEDYCKALLCRLRFRKHFHHVVTCMRRPHGRGLDLARKHITSCLTELSLMLKSQEFLKSQSDIILQQGDASCTTASGCRPIGFDVSLNSRLLSPAPPRAVEILAWGDAIRYFEKLMHDLDIICALSLDPVLENVLHFIAQFQKSLPDLVPRAFLQTLLIQDGKIYGRDLICDVISRALSLPDIIGDKEFQTNEFVVQLGQKGDSVRDAAFPAPCLLLQCYVLLSEGLSMLLAALRNESKSFQLPSIFNSEQERFIQHFDLLQKARIPEGITYYSFKEAAAQAHMADVMKYNFFKEIQKIIPSLKGSFAGDPEKLAEIRQIEQVAEHNRIALNIINHVGAGDPSLRVSFEFTYHPHFAVAVVKRS